MQKKYERPALFHITGKDDLICAGYICSPGASPHERGACKSGNTPTGGCNAGNSRKSDKKDFTSKFDSIISCNEGLQLNGYLYIVE